MRHIGKGKCLLFRSDCVKQRYLLLDYFQLKRGRLHSLKKRFFVLVCSVVKECQTVRVLLRSGNISFIFFC